MYASLSEIHGCEPCCFRCIHCPILTWNLKRHLSKRTVVYELCSGSVLLGRGRSITPGQSRSRGGSCRGRRQVAGRRLARQRLMLILWALIQNSADSKGHIVYEEEACLFKRLSCLVLPGMSMDLAIHTSCRPRKQLQSQNPCTNLISWDAEP